jgi:hypothetical protein
MYNLSELKIQSLLQNYSAYIIYRIFDIYLSLPNTVRIMKLRMRWAGHVARIGEKRNAYRLLVGKPEGNKALGRPRHR